MARGQDPIPISSTAIHPTQLPCFPGGKNPTYSYSVRNALEESVWLPLSSIASTSHL